MTYDAKSILRQNLQRRMDADPSIDSPTKLAKKCFWPRGKKKGKPIAARTIGYIFEDDDNSPSPSLDVIEATARALKVEIWELLTDTEHTRRTLIERILGATGYPDEKLSPEWKAPAAAQPRATYHPPQKKRHP